MTNSEALAFAAPLALVISNSPWSAACNAFLDRRGEVRVGDDWRVLRWAMHAAACKGCNNGVGVKTRFHVSIFLGQGTSS